MAYVEVVCPYLENDKCSIYEDRFRCCRNFPQVVGKCSDRKCGCKCDTCEDICCKHILVPDDITVDKTTIREHLNMFCENCHHLHGRVIK